jgi:hypothetical protein
MREDGIESSDVAHAFMLCKTVYVGTTQIDDDRLMEKYGLFPSVA